MSVPLAFGLSGWLVAAVLMLRCSTMQEVAQGLIDDLMREIIKLRAELDLERRPQQIRERA